MAVTAFAALPAERAALVEDADAERGGERSPMRNQPGAGASRSTSRPSHEPTPPSWASDTRVERVYA
jgi:hypothetical protein